MSAALALSSTSMLHDTILNNVIACALSRWTIDAVSHFRIAEDGGLLGNEK